MSDQLDAVEALAVDFNPLTASLSPIALAVFNYAWYYLNDRQAWLNGLNPLDEITDSQWDTIQSYTAQAYAEIDRSTMIGQVTSYITEFPPPNVLSMDGSILARVTYPELYAVIDPIWHIDADTFQLPDLRNRVIVGAGDDYSPSDSGGSDTVTLTTAQMPSHSHTASAPTVIDPSHSHVESGAGLSAVTIGAGVPAPVAVPFPTATAPAFTGISVLAPSISSEGGSGAHENRQPFMALNYGVIFR